MFKYQIYYFCTCNLAQPLEVIMTQQQMPETTYAGAWVPPQQHAGQKSFIATWLFAWLLGGLGVDRFYLGKIGTGVLKLITFGGLGVWVLVDLIITLSGAQRDKQGMPLNGYQQHKKLAWIVTGAVIALGILIGALSPKPTATTQIADPAPSVEAEPAAIEEPVEDAVADEAPEEQPVEETPVAEEPAEEPIVEEPVAEEPVEAPVEEEAPVAEEEAEPSVPAEYTSALTSAETYSDMMHMSKAGIFDQLTSEYGGQFTEDAAQYAVDTIDADWNNNALESAKTYQNEMAMSPAAIHDQLTSEYGGQFTSSQADYAIDNLNG